MKQNLVTTDKDRPTGYATHENRSYQYTFEFDNEMKLQCWSWKCSKKMSYYKCFSSWCRAAIKKIVNYKHPAILCSTIYKTWALPTHSPYSPVAALDSPKSRRWGQSREQGNPSSFKRGDRIVLFDVSSAIHNCRQHWCTIPQWDIILAKPFVKICTRHYSTTLSKNFQRNYLLHLRSSSIQQKSHYCKDQKWEMEMSFGTSTWCKIGAVEPTLKLWGFSEANSSSGRK